MRIARYLAVGGALVALGLLLVRAPAIEAADHTDSAKVKLPANVKADIADFYAFLSPADNGNVVLVMTVAALTPAGMDQGFDDATRYDFHVDTDDDQKSDHKFSVRTKGTQIRVKGPNVDIQGDIGKVLTEGNVKFWAGVADDPFFIDLTGLADTLSSATDKFTGADPLAGTNVSAIVLEMPKAMLQGGASQTKLGLWATTTR
ncbi:MAG: DUF4331 family protein [Myxococcales bacterium]|nr:DUF4331 family protein [Myxococcales bacterium]